MDLWIDFLNVGQGDCSIISLPDGRLFIIDTGPKDSGIIHWLKRNKTHYKKATLLLTHNDLDHTACALAVRAELGSMLDEIFRVDDSGPKPANEHRKDLIKMILDAKSSGIPVWNMVSCPERRLPPLYKRKIDGRTIVIDCVHPVIESSLRQEKLTSPDHNSMSAIVCLWVDDKLKVTWPGDAHYSTVAQYSDSHVPYLVGPHHGAPKDTTLSSFESVVKDHRPGLVWISVGTENDHDHPLERYVKMHAGHGSRICCSQLNHCGKDRIAPRRHVVKPHETLYHQPPKGTTCRGAMRLQWNDRTQKFDPRPAKQHREHRQLIEEGKVKGALCLA